MLPNNDSKTIMDARTVQNMLMKTRIPQKRTHMQRNKSMNDDESDQEMRETRGQTGQDGNMSDGSDIERPPMKR